MSHDIGRINYEAYLGAVKENRAAQEHLRNSPFVPDVAQEGLVAWEKLDPAHQEAWRLAAVRCVEYLLRGPFV